MFSGSLHAGIPRKINYQGKLADSITGEPRVGSQNMIFRIYDDPGAGTLLWSESQTVPADSAGIFSTILGSITPIDVSLDGQVWLEVEVGGQVLSPRREMVSVPFAFQAEVAGQSRTADSLSGYAAGDFVMKGEISAITSEMIADGTGSGLDADMVDGLDAGAFADTGHVHDERYYTQGELSTPGLINETSNPVEWTALKGVPAGFADGTDDLGGAGDGHSLDAVDGTPADAVYVDADGRVGVGTLSPVSKLDIGGDVNVTGHLLMDERTVLSTDGLFNLRLGWGAGTNSTGDYNTFMGCQAGSTNTEGYHNTFVGFAAGRGNTSGTVNTFVGYGAGLTNTTGSANTFVGYIAGLNNMTGRWNTFLGYYTGTDNATGEGNTFLGAGAGDACLDGSDNCLVGRAAGYESVSGHQNTYVGSFSGFSGTAGHGNVFLGYQAGYSETGSDKLYIANGQSEDDVLIYGDFASGRVGIGTTNPGEALEVNGAAKITAVGSPLKLRTGAGYIELESDNPDPMGLRLSNSRRDWYLINGTSLEDRLSIYDSSSGKERLVIAGMTGRVGIGESHPLSSLTINSNLQEGMGLTYPGITIGNPGSHATLQIGGGSSDYCSFHWTTPDGLMISSTGHLWLNTNGHHMMLSEDGEVGIGTVTPAEQLHIVGGNPRILIEGEASNPEVNFKCTGDPSSEIWAIYKSVSNDDLNFYQNGANRVTIKNSTGSVGIGTNNVGGYKLYVQGEAYATGGWTPSDLRFKEEISGIDNALDKLLGLRGVLFRWKTEEYGDKGFPEGEHYGVIAQDAQKVLPEIVKEGPDGDLAVAYAEIIPVLVEAIRELKTENADLRQRIEALEGTSH
jgi:hypothetical protein